MIDKADCARTIVAGRTGRCVAPLLICSLLVAGCASNSSPAPVEQRRSVPSSQRSSSPATLPAAQVRSQAAQPSLEQGGVEVTGLGDDATSGQPPPRITPGATGQTGPSLVAPSRSVAPRPGSSRVPASGSAPGFAVANPAVVALLNRANRDAAAGRQGASAASLERAIKIEPGNAWLWHRLAQTRLKQNQPAEAASIAARSNSLAGNDDALRARNWRLIATVHQLRGESVAAKAAQRKAESLERGTS